MIAIPGNASKGVVLLGFIVGGHFCCWKLNMLANRQVGMMREVKLVVNVLKAYRACAVRDNYFVDFQSLI